MQDKIGNEYEGTISGVTEWGIYVEIEPTKVEGMVSLRDIKDDFFIFDEKNYCVIGKSSRVKFTLGDKVKIKVSKVNIEQKLIDYELVWDPGYNKAKKRETKGKADAKSKAQAKAKGKAAPKSKANTKSKARK